MQGGVYMGVGPEQNFTYIAAIRPAMAFIVDIRRQAVMQHLMFKAMFELAKDRADFISLLFAQAAAGRPRERRAHSEDLGRVLDGPDRSGARGEELRAHRRAADEDARLHVHGGRAAQLDAVFEAFYVLRARRSRRAAADGAAAAAAG